MAGERLRATGWTEVSAVCTRPEQRGQGLATALVREIVAGARSRGDEAVLHVADANTTARSLYDRLGFTARQAVTAVILRCPE
jgi:predicted GNAT family acetyltransferase